MTTRLIELAPGLPPVSILTVIGFGLMCGTLVLYMLSRIPELLLITIISFLYGVVPLISTARHI